MKQEYVGIEEWKWMVWQGMKEEDIKVQGVQGGSLKGRIKGGRGLLENGNG